MRQKPRLLKSQLLVEFKLVIRVLSPIQDYNIAGVAYIENCLLFDLMKIRLSHDRCILLTAHVGQY